MTVNSLTLSSENTILTTHRSTIFCSKASPAANDRVIGCLSLSATTTTSTGLLATVVITASGDGCVYVGSITAPGDASRNTFTLNPVDSTMQTNTVSTELAHVLVGSGTEIRLPDPHSDANHYEHADDHEHARIHANRDEHADRHT